MAVESLQLQQTREEEFQPGEVMTIVGAHFTHDTYTAFVAPLLPVIIEKLSLSLTLAGSLTAILQLPGIINPFLGYLADRISLRYFVILAPAITATLISLTGLAPTYTALAILLFITGISVAAFHAPAPAMIGRLSGKKIGMGMSLFMAGGELGRSLGPLIAVAAVSIWSLDGIYRLMFIGWAASAILYWRLRHTSARMEKRGRLQDVLPMFKRLYLPLAILIFFRNFMFVSLSTFLPTFMDIEGASLALAGGALSILEIAGVAGALVSGTLSDRLGRKPILIVSTILSSLVMLLFLNISGWVLVPVLLVLGFSALSTMPVLLAVVQEHLPGNRAVGNGLFMTLAFLLRPINVVLIGYIGDQFSLRTAFTWSAYISLLAIPAIFFLPQLKSKLS
jgi:FSR family fosmidomycin resistance protein-like MFS transporter